MEHGAPGRARRPLPLPGSPPGVPLAPAGVIYGMGRIDASGRVADRAVTCALGWTRGDRLVLTADAGVVLARRDPSVPVIVPPRPYVTIPIPSALRRRCGLRAGDQVLLGAIHPGRGHARRLLLRRGGPGNPGTRRVPVRKGKTAMTTPAPAAQ
jgi:hypothetical protein